MLEAHHIAARNCWGWLLAIKHADVESDKPGGVVMAGRRRRVHAKGGQEVGGAGLPRAPALTVSWKWG